ncbi:RNA polymerase factor sigma-54 [Microvirga pudoricolor]|uniref:RNA polymerase factor sigma-54 n=1 Tax=Microvirga pudoricolor TaxID=2778729 RepID=UPI00194E8E01|nr:RNA polymerase factor sigma-54 [Microvirga pudoricolor]MBM6594048.1 RNA polymerase factor sigma-54 [Microvirga pudoricolor]
MGSMQRLELRQGQTLVMTPQLLQAIKLLQLSHLDLASYVGAECERNPLLAHPEPGPDTGSGAPDGRTGGSDLEWGGEPGAGAQRDSEAPQPPEQHPFEPSDALPPTSLSLGRGGLQSGSGRAGSGDPSQGGDFATAVAAPIGLAEHLERQLDLCGGEGPDRLIAQHVIHSLDETGYLVETISEIASRLGVPEARIERALALVQGFDPPGVGARTLAECLGLQLKDRNRFDPCMEALLTRLDLVAKRDLGALRRLCGVDDEDLADMLAEIRSLDPKPGLAFGSASPQFLVPDVLVRAAPDGTWVIELNPETLPRVLVDQTYYLRLSRAARSDEDRAFLSECLQSANWLKRSLDQRARTILKVAGEIVRHQDGFFRHGVSHLRPLTLKTVADAIGMHESTVSRVTANKAFGTSRGPFEMKYFFSAAIAGATGGEAHASEAVRHRIRQLVDAEAADAVLSDDAIAQKLKHEGVDIARRTIAKYRESLRIPSSADRRRAKRA